MSRACLVLNGHNTHTDFSQYEYIVAVDGGYNYLKQLSIVPNIIVGDFDSIRDYDKTIKTIEYDPIKDYTDFELAIKHVKELHKDEEIDVYGFTSLDRVDHVIGNIQTLEPGINLISDNQIIFTKDKEFEMQKDKYQYISFFTTKEIYITLEGFKYPLDKYKLVPGDNLCISNELINDLGRVIITGTVTIIKSIKE
ncbi:MAG: thiamine diphosphokinase [Mycoplasmatales bacterium]